MRLQTIFLMAVGIAFACCAVLGGVSFVNNLRDHRSYASGVNELQHFHRALDAASAVSAERGPANSAMGPEVGNESRRIEKLKAKRLETDQLIDILRSSVTVVSRNSPETKDLMALVDQRLADGRRAVDAVTAMPVALRSSDRIIGAIETMFAASDAIATLRDRLGRDIISTTPQISTQVILGMSASSMREQAGRLGSYVVMMLSADTIDDVWILSRLQKSAGQLELQRRTIENYGAAFFPDPVLQRAISDVERYYFLEALPFANRTALVEARNNTMSAASFTEQYVPGLLYSDTLRKLIIRHSADKLERLRSDAFRNVVLSAALSAAICVILLGVAIVFKLSLFDPLLVARGQIITIARGELAEPPETGSISREVHDMFEGLKVLRRQQVHKRELEREQTHLSQRLKDLSERDPLTGLLNRRAIEMNALRLIEEADLGRTFLAVILLDVDHFKTINDTYGHAAGDLALQKVADELKTLLRPGDQFARIGGEEFVVLLANSPENDALIVAERLRRHLGTIFIRADIPVKITASFGVAMRPPGSNRTWEQLLQVADKRLYVAKHAGRDRVCATDEADISWPRKVV